MTPAARWAAAAQILDEISSGAPAEKALTNWARRSRFAGSKDRAAIRDHVFDILRCWRSSSVLGGGTTGRALVLGRLRETGVDAETVFTGEGYALAPLTPVEKTDTAELTAEEAANLPDWLFQIFQNDLGAEADVISKTLQTRAPAFLRVNTLKTDMACAQRLLDEAGIETETHAVSPTALQVLNGARKIAQSTPYLTGLVELQDAASQAVVDALPIKPDMRVLDYCAGGGGKTLAMAARTGSQIEAHDADPKRMADLPGRAERAGAHVKITRNPNGLYDLVLCDAPCSGSGAWRRSPEGKWRLTPERLAHLNRVQSDILDEACGLIAPGGRLAYATCSVLRSENEDQRDAFLSRHSDWMLERDTRFSPTDGGDGFYLAVFAKA